MDFLTIKIGIVYSSFYKNISQDDKILIKAIEQKSNLEYTIFDWDQNNSIDFILKNQLNLLLIRNTWVTHHSESFESWLERVKNTTNIIILNDLDMVKWNCSKIYLKELRDELLINIIPSIFIKKSTNVKNLKSIVGDAITDGTFSNDTTKFVYKPAIGSEGYGVEFFSIENDNLTHHINKMNQLLQKSDIIVQPFLKSIVDEGEYSFIFFNSRFSHSSIKTTPNKNEFKVQNGGIERIKPNQNDLEIAKSISRKLSKKFKTPILYARIDMIRYNNQLFLNELDIVEPNLYFQDDQSLAQIFLENLLTIYNNHYLNKSIKNNNNNINNYHINK